MTAPQRRLVGVLGGMGPAATVDFLQRLLDAHPVSRDQDHVPTVVWNVPQIPDRQLALAGQGADPLPAMAEGMARLNAAGATCIAIPCNTAHAWWGPLSAHSAAPVLHIVDVTVQALRRSGITVEPQYIARGNFTYEAGSNALEQLLSLPVPPTAVFCHSDIMALGALSLAKRRGLKIPDDLSIIGFDNISLSEFCDPPLTTVAQPRFDIGREAMLLLLDQLHGHSVSSGSRLLDCELIVRGSTRKIRA